MVLSCDGVSLLFSDLPLSQILEFAEDMRGRPADDKQRSIGVLIRKQFIVFPVETPLSPDLIAGD